MAIGGHIIVAADGENLFHFEENIGFGRFPAIPADLSFFENWHIDVVSLNDIWIGHFRNTGSASYVSHWDGTAWTTDTLPSSPDNCYVSVSVDRTSGVVWAMGDGAGTNWRVCWKYTPGSGWQHMWEDNANDGHVIVLSVSSSNFYFTSENPAAGVGFFTGTASGPTQYPSAADIPDGGYRGLCRKGSEIFLLTDAGQVWKGIPGAFTQDNVTDGPFTVTPLNAGASIATSADGQTVVVSAQDAYYVRDGDDDWSSVGPVGGAGTQHTPAAVSRQILLGNFANNTRMSCNGGSNWHQVTNEGGVGASAVLADISAPDKLLLALYYFKETYSLWVKGDDKYSPWARWDHPSTVGQAYPARARIDTVTGISTRFSCIEACATGEVFVGIEVGGTSSTNFAWHYDPTGNSWSVITNAKRPCRRIFATEYAVGRIHAVGEYGGGITYFRWNGTSYDDTDITGSSDGSGRWNISATEDGQHIWITVDGSQLWHSSNGGSTWTNRHAASAAIHSNGGDAVDVHVTSANNVLVVHEEAGAGGDLYFSKWNGSSWSVAAPPLTTVYVDQKCLYVDPSGNYWIITKSGGLWKYSGGSWSQIEPFYSHNHSPTDFEAFNDLSVMAICTRAPDTNHIDVDHRTLPLDWYTCQSGNNNIPAAQKWVGIGKIAPPAPTLVESSVVVNNIFVVARDLIKVNFSNLVAVTPSLLAPSTYSLSGGLSVSSVLPPEGRSANFVYLVLLPKAILETEYTLVIESAGDVDEIPEGDLIPEGTIYTIRGVPLRRMTTKWTHKRTKVDSVLASLANMYDIKLGSNLRMILQAITISDEEIGGDF